MQIGDLVQRKSNRLPKQCQIGIVVDTVVKDNIWYFTNTKVLWDKGLIEWLPSEILVKLND